MATDRGNLCGEILASQEEYIIWCLHLGISSCFSIGWMVGHKLDRTVFKSTMTKGKHSLNKAIGTSSISAFAHHHFRLSCTWDGVLNSGDLHILHFSCLLDTVLLPFIERLAMKPQPYLTTLTIHTQFKFMSPPSTSIWICLARKSPAIRQITLPEVQDDFLELLAKDFGIWPVMAHLGFIHGPRKLDGLQKMLVSWSESRVPVQKVTIYNRNLDWCREALYELQRLVEVETLERVHSR
jgi:hypothetical protein